MGNNEEREKTKSVVEEVNDAVKSENAAAQKLKSKMDESVSESFLNAGIQ